jgi:magnesium transporter
VRITADDLNDTIVRHARKNVTTLRSDQTVGEALEALRTPRLTDRVVYLYVLDSTDRLIGVVPVRRLLMSPPNQAIGTIMVGPVVTVRDTATVLEVCEEFLDHRFLALPVVDGAGRLMGIVDISLFTDEVLAFARRQGADNVFQLIGVHVALGRRVPPWTSFRDRFPWLLCNVASGTLCALIAAGHQALIRDVALLALFITVVLALAESVSMQSMTLTLQALVERKVSWRRALLALRKEFVVAAMLGLGGGALVGATVLLWQRTVPGALAVGAAILLSMLTACLLGVVVPTLLRAFRANPHVAAGPIVLAAADVFTILLYFTLAQAFLARS